MVNPDIQQETDNGQAEPLLPIEKTLIAWSLLIGIALLIIFALFNIFVPI
ncbi:MAG: hypothetical protein NNA20_12490 [Nitrospira sp.]|nr:hypothetical protein [Nitrospira sp.]